MIFNQDNSDLVSAINAITPLDTVPTANSQKGITSHAVAEALTATSFGTITKIIEGGTLAYTTCYKRGNVVCVSGLIHSFSLVASDRNYFQIPAGYRPTQQTYVIGYMQIDGANTPVLVKIAADGIVSAGYSPSKTATQVGFSACYAI